MTRYSRFRVLAAAALLVQACATTPPPSMIVTHPDGFRTFTVAQEHDGHPVVCPAFAVVDPVRGTFQGGAGQREPAWLVDDAGRRLSVVWPEGFVVRFEPLAALYDDRGMVVVRDRQAVELGQVARDSATGSYEDPYIAQGLVFDGCYPFVTKGTT